MRRALRRSFNSQAESSTPHNGMVKARIAARPEDM